MTKRVLAALAVIVVLAPCVYYAKRRYYDPAMRRQHAEAESASLLQSHELRDGDLIFHTSLSAQSKAIQLATKSKYSHCGIIYYKDGEIYVFEAVQPVKLTPLSRWIARGEGGHYVVKRLKNADRILTPATLQKMKTVGDRFTGRNYDLYFEWSDDRIYCSELIWKIYHEAAGVDIGNLQKLREFDLTSDPVRRKMAERYGANVPLDETVISPAAMFESDLLVTVRQH